MSKTAFRLAICSIAATIMALASQVSAQNARTSGVARKRAATIIATLPDMLGPTVCTTPTSPITDFSMECPSGDCGCYTIMNATISGDMLGKGTASLLLNADLSLPASSTTASNGANTCTPIFGTITANTTKGRGRRSTGVKTIFNVVGSLCMPLANNGSGSLNGGFGVSSSTATPPTKGYGAITGDVTPRGTLIINMKGPVS